MLRLFTDFNSRLEDGTCWISSDNNHPEEGRFIEGGRVILFQDEDDFEVEATLTRKFVEQIEKYVWLATLEWDTKKSTNRLQR